MGASLGVSVGEVLGISDGCWEPIDGVLEGATGRALDPPQAQHASSIVFPKYSMPAYFAQ